MDTICYNVRLDSRHNTSQPTRSDSSTEGITSETLVEHPVPEQCRICEAPCQSQGINSSFERRTTYRRREICVRSTTDRTRWKNGQDDDQPRPLPPGPPRTEPIQGFDVRGELKDSDQQPLNPKKHGFSLKAQIIVGYLVDGSIRKCFHDRFFTTCTSRRSVVRQRFLSAFHLSSVLRLVSRSSLRFQCKCSSPPAGSSCSLNIGDSPGRVIRSINWALGMSPIHQAGCHGTDPRKKTEKPARKSPPRPPTSSGHPRPPSSRSSPGPFRRRPPYTPPSQGRFGPRFALCPSPGRRLLPTFHTLGHACPPVSSRTRLCSNQTCPSSIRQMNLFTTWCPGSCTPQRAPRRTCANCSTHSHPGSRKSSASTIPCHLLH